MTENNPNLKHKYLIALSHFSKFGPARLARLRAGFEDFEQAFKANLNGLIRARIEENIANEFISFRNSLDPDKLLSDLDREQIKVASWGDDEYPKTLAQIYGPPQILYYRGVLVGDEEGIAVVGSRRFSHYGKQAADSLARGLSQNGVTIVSGLAVGIDSFAHMAAVEAGGRTVAIIGSGLDRQNIYPSQNRYLADKIVARGGAVVSEFPMGTPPLKFNFPQRNRVIAGLARATLVIECRQKSGAMITANHALDFNREVFAVPGNIFSDFSEGPNFLIKQGAIPALSCEQILESLDLKDINQYSENKKILPETEDEKNIYQHLGAEPLHIDDIIRQSGLPANIVNSSLVMMEMKGMVKNLGGMNYVAKN